jgi:hypothetical protein
MPNGSALSGIAGDAPRRGGDLGVAGGVRLHDCARPGHLNM